MAEITDLWQNGEKQEESAKRITAKIEELGLKREDFVCMGNNIQTGITTYTNDAEIVKRVRDFYG